MEFLVELDINVQEAPEVHGRLQAEVVPTDELAAAGHLVRLWRLPAPTGQTKILGLYRADTDIELDDLLRKLPLAQGVHPTLTQLDPHPNDPGGALLSPLPPADSRG